jgi:hypothetical protein
MGVRTIGMHPIQGSWHFACQAGSLGPHGEVDELLLESDYPLYTKLLSEKAASEAELRTLLTYLFRFNSIDVVVPLIGWFVASFYKERIFAFTRQFPLLFIFGAAGAGKTQTILTLKNLFSLDQDNVKSIADVTNFTLIKAAASSNTIPLMLDEYKSSQFSPQQTKMISKLIRAAYNNELGERGTSSQRIMQYFYKSPIIIAGEQTVSEPAAKERIIEVHMTKPTSRPHLAEFERLKTDGLLPKLGRLLLEEALAITQSDLKAMFDSCLAEVPEAYRDRPKTNQAIMLAGLRLLEAILDKHGLGKEVRWAVASYWKCKAPSIAEEVAASSKSDVDRILEAINIMAENQKTALYHGSDFIIEGNVLKINMHVIYAQFVKFASEYQLDADTPNYTSFLKLIKKEPYFIRDDQPTKLGQNVRLVMFLDVARLKAKKLVLSAIIPPDDTEVKSTEGELSLDD